MSINVEELISDIRLVVSDKDKTRWTDAELVRLISNGVTNFVALTKILITTKYLTLVNNQDLYTINDAIEFLDFGGILVTTRDDNYDNTTVIINNSMANSFKVAPIITNGVDTQVALVDTKPSTPSIKITYAYKHPAITETSTLLLDDIYAQAIVAFVTGTLLSYDQDSISRELATTQLGLFNSFVKIANEKSFIYNSIPTVYTSTYNKAI